jgi:hypothetical protein
MGMRRDFWPKAEAFCPEATMFTSLLPKLPLTASNYNACTLSKFGSFICWNAMNITPAAIKTLAVTVLIMD